MEKIQEFPVPTDELWDAIADADQLGAWLGDELEVDLRPGGQGRLVDDGEVRRLVVEEVTPGERLSFTWWPETPDGAGPPTTVELVVEPAPAGSRLIVRERAPLSTRWSMHLHALALHCAARTTATLRC
ncbi:MAG: SRPBCC domain-containing protein [Acidimicrobiia bacterium]